MMGGLDWLIVAVGVIVTLAAARLAQRTSRDTEVQERVAGRSLGPWVMGISATAAAGSGAMLTGLVGLGYSFGLVWCLMPLGYLFGDILFWMFLAHRLHDASTQNGAVSLPQMMAGRLPDLRSRKYLSRLIGGFIVLLMIPYITAQWMAAGKMGGLILNHDVTTITLIAAGLVIAYTAFSGIRGAAYTDYVQGVLMLLFAATILALVAMAWPDADMLQEATSQLPPHFFSFTGDLSILQASMMFIGFAGLAVTFNLGQPHMVNRWLSAQSSATMRQGRWIYLLTSQFLFLGFTALGAFLRLMVESPDPEQALVVFMREYAFPGAMGILVIGAVSTIASTASAIVAVCADTLRFDVLDRAPSTRNKQLSVLLIGVGSLVALLFSDGSVFNMAITAVSLLGATLAGPVLFFIFGLRFTAVGLSAGLIAGFAAGVAWVALGLSNTLNESLPGLLAGVIVLWLFKPRP